MINAQQYVLAALARGKGHKPPPDTGFGSKQAVLWPPPDNQYEPRPGGSVFHFNPQVALDPSQVKDVRPTLAGLRGQELRQSEHMRQAILQGASTMKNNTTWPAAYRGVGNTLRLLHENVLFSQGGMGAIKGDMGGFVPQKHSYNVPGRELRGGGPQHDSNKQYNVPTPAALPPGLYNYLLQGRKFQNVPV